MAAAIGMAMMAMAIVRHSLMQLGVYGKGKVGGTWWALFGEHTIL